MLTAAVTKLGMTESWFWDTEPRKLLAMLDEKRKMDISDKRLLVHILNGGKTDDDSDTKAGIPGIDYPAGEGSTAWLHK